MAEPLCPAWLLFASVSADREVGMVLSPSIAWETRLELALEFINSGV